MQLVQSAHAAFEAGRQELPPDIEGAEKPYIVVCETADEASLREAATMLDNCGIPYEMFTEDDLGGQATALCTLLLNDEQRSKLAHWKTWKKPAEKRAHEGV